MLLVYWISLVAASASLLTTGKASSSILLASSGFDEAAFESSRSVRRDR